MRVVIVDDHVLFRVAIRRLLEAASVQIVGEAATGGEALALIEASVPDLVLMDIGLPGDDGLVVTAQIQEKWPGLPVVILTGSTNRDDLMRAFQVGARGYLPKTASPEQFLSALAAAERGEFAILPEMASTALHDLAVLKPKRPGPTTEPLTDRELEVLTNMARGVTTTCELSDAMRISENTVKFHVRNILLKLDSGTRAQAVALALRNGIVSP